MVTIEELIQVGLANPYQKANPGGIRFISQSTLPKPID